MSTLFKNCTRGISTRIVADNGHDNIPVQELNDPTRAATAHSFLHVSIRCNPLQELHLWNFDGHSVNELKLGHLVLNRENNPVFIEVLLHRTLASPSKEKTATPTAAPLPRNPLWGSWAPPSDKKNVSRNISLCGPNTTHNTHTTGTPHHAQTLAPARHRVRQASVLTPGFTSHVLPQGSGPDWLLSTRRPRRRGSAAAGLLLLSGYIISKRITIDEKADLSKFCSFIFVGKMCVFVSSPMNIVTFLLKNDYPPKTGC